MASYNTVTALHPYRLLGPGNQQSATNLGLLWTPPAMNLTQVGGSPTAQVSTLLEGMGLGGFEIQNRSGSTVVTGIGVRLPNRLWIAGQWTDAAGTPYADDTTDAQSTATADFPLETTTANDGFVVASPVPFNAISIDVATASAGSPVRVFRYSSSDGTGWTALTSGNMLVQDYASTNYAVTGSTVANEALYVWDLPTDWGRTQSGGLNGVPQGLYAINVRATTAPSTAGAADSLAVCRLYWVNVNVTNNTAVSRDYSGKEWRMPDGNGLVVLFDTASPANRVAAQVRLLT